MTRNYIRTRYEVRYKEQYRYLTYTLSFHTYLTPQISQIVNGRGVPINKVKPITSFRTYQNYYLGVI